MIQARELTKRYDGTLAVDALSFTVEPGIVTGFLGPNGAGKSTTMRMMMGLDRPTSGSVLVNGRHRGDIWLAWDMSERHELDQQRLEAQRELAEQNERLRKLDEARNQFLAIVSHELRTPLTSIVSFSELIRGEADGLTPEGVRFLDIIERNADRLHRLVGDLLILDRLEAGALPLDPGSRACAPSTRPGRNPSTWSCSTSGCRRWTGGPCWSASAT